MAEIFIERASTQYMNFIFDDWIRERSYKVLNRRLGPAKEQIEKVT